MNNYYYKKQTHVSLSNIIPRITAKLYSKIKLKQNNATRMQNRGHLWGSLRLVSGDLSGAEDVYLLIYYTDEFIWGKSVQFHIYDLCFSA